MSPAAEIRDSVSPYLHLPLRPLAEAQRASEQQSRTTEPRRESGVSSCDRK